MLKNLIKEEYDKINKNKKFKDEIEYELSIGREIVIWEEYKTLREIILINIIPYNISADYLIPLEHDDIDWYYKKISEFF